MTRATTTQRGYGSTHQSAARQLIADHVARYGYHCPGLDDVPMHPSRDLVADHNVAGHPEHGYTIRCRSCNTKRMNGWRG